MEDNIQLELKEVHDMEKLTGALESILFAAGDSVKNRDLMKILGVSQTVLDAIVTGYKESLEQTERGLRLLVLEDRLQLATKEEHSPYLRELLGVNERQGLSKGALECLSVIAFKQPVTRLEIDEIRGVNSEYVLQKLTEKTLIKEVGRKDAPGRPRLYGTTDDFLIQFGFTSLKELKKEIKAPERPEVVPEQDPEQQQIIN